MATATALEVPAASKKQKLRGAEKSKRSHAKLKKKIKIWSQNGVNFLTPVLESQFIIKYCDSKNGPKFYEKSGVTFCDKWSAKNGNLEPRFLCHARL